MSVSLANGGAPTQNKAEEQEASVSFQFERDGVNGGDDRIPFANGEGSETNEIGSYSPRTNEVGDSPLSAADGGKKDDNSSAIKSDHRKADDTDADARAEAQEVLDAPAADVVETKHDNVVVAYFKRLKGAGKPGPKWFVWTWDTIPAFLFTGITLMVLAVIEAFGLQPYDLGMQSFLPSFGASCCMVMCLLTSPGAQPRALVPTHIVGAFLGVSWSHITSNLDTPLNQQLASAFAVSMLTVIMMITGTFQPSASATTCLAAFHLYGQLNDKGFMFLVAPATLGPLVIVFLGWVLNNLVPWRHCYPVWW